MDLCIDVCGRLEKGGSWGLDEEAVDSGLEG
jgi:hypothetical protein